MTEVEDQNAAKIVYGDWRDREVTNWYVGTGTWCVYAYLGAEDVILYVGCTNNLLHRHRHHIGFSWWGRRAVRLVVAMMGDEANCLHAERRTIRRVRPLFNLRHNRGRLTAARRYLEEVPPGDRNACYEMRRAIDVIDLDELLRLAKP